MLRIGPDETWYRIPESRQASGGVRLNTVATVGSGRLRWIPAGLRVRMRVRNKGLVDHPHHPGPQTTSSASSCEQTLANQSETTASPSSPSRPMGWFRKASRLPFERECGIQRAEAGAAVARYERQRPADLQRGRRLRHARRRPACPQAGHVRAARQAISHSPAATVTAGLTVRLLSRKSRPGGEEPRESPSVP